MNRLFKTMLPLWVLAFCNVSTAVTHAAEYPYTDKDGEYGIISTENAELIKDGDKVYLIEKSPGYMEYYGPGIGANWDLRTNLKVSWNKQRLHYTAERGFHLIDGQENPLRWNYEVLKAGQAKIYTETAEGKRYVKQSAKFVEVKNQKGKTFKLFLLELDAQDGDVFSFSGSSK